MHTSLSKKLLAGLLSLVMVLSLVAPSMGTQAASKYSLTDKKSVKSGVTFKYQLKGVSKNQYVKVTRNVSGETVKYNKKAVSKTTKINGTGKTLNLYVTYGDKVANYTGKFTVKIYSKKTNKVVKTIVEKTTVKVTPLEVTNVEVASTSGKYLVAEFNKKLDTLKVADITVREETTGTLKGVESVTLASDGKSANVALVGTEDGMRNQFIEPNIDYVFTVSQAGVSAATTFTMDAVVTRGIVEDVDGSKNTIDVAKNDGTGVSTYTVPESIELNYEEALGRTVTFWYDKANTITKFTYHNEKVVYGAFATTKDTVADKAYLTDVVSGAKYYTQDSDVPNATTGEITIKATEVIRKDTGANVIANYRVTEANSNDRFAYAKLILNSNGTIKEIVSLGAWTDSILVGSVKGNEISAGSSALSLKDYTIVKDGKEIAITDIAVGDVVFYNSAAKFAEVYTNKATGALEGVFSGRFKFAGKTYNEQLLWTGTKLHYVGTGIKDVDDDYMELLKASGKDITVYFARTGEPVYVAGELGEEETTFATVVLTDNAKVSDSSFKNEMLLTGFNGEKITSYKIDMANITSMINEAGDYFAIGHYKNDDKTEKKVVKFKVVAFDTEANAHVQAVYADGMTEDVIAAGTVDDTGVLDKKKLVELEFNAKGDVIGLYYGNGDAFDGNTNTGTTKDLTSGYTTISGLQTNANVPVYIYKIADDTVKVVTYGKLSGSVAYANAANVMLYAGAARNLAYIVITDSTKLTGNSGDEITKEVVVSSKEYNSKGELVELTVVSGDSEEPITYTSFDSKIVIPSNTIPTGKIIELTTLVDGKTVTGITPVTPDAFGSYSQTALSGNKFVVGGYSLRLATTVTPTIVKVDNTDPANPKVVKISFAELEGISEQKNVLVSYLGDSTLYVDTIVVEDTTSAQYTAAKASIDAYLTGAGATIAATTALSAATYNTFDTVINKVETDMLADAQGKVHANVQVKVNPTGGNLAASTAATQTLKYTVTVSLDGYTLTSSEFTLTMGA